MKIAIIGYGKMGHEIEKVAEEHGHKIVCRFSSTAPIQPATLSSADVAIEFTRPELAVSNITACMEAGVPIVVGTTGWYGRFDEVKSLQKEHHGSLFHATNFSLGVNVFFEVNRRLAKLMNQHEHYTIELEEIHHTEKLDSPSGTAITIAEGILDEVDRKTDWKEAPVNSPTELSIEAKREPKVPGTHAVKYESAVDQIEIKHTAKSRKGFALGAVIAAEFLKGKTGIYKMSDLI